eukprot:403337490
MWKRFKFSVDIGENQCSQIYARDLEILHRLSEDRRKSLIDFVVILQKKVQAEFIYAKALEDLSNLNLGSIEKTQFEEFANTLKINSRNKALQAWELGDSLSKDVIEPLKKLKIAQEQEALEIYEQAQQLIQSIKSKQEEVKQYTSQYQRVAKQANQCYDDWNKIKESEKHGQTYKDQMLKDAHQYRKESEEKMIIYKSMVKRANEFKKYFQEQMSYLLKRLEEHENERIECLKAAADKIIVYETSQDMNNKYDAKAFARTIDEINGDKQIKFFKSKINLMKIDDLPDFQFVKIATYEIKESLNASVISQNYQQNVHQKHQIFGLPQKQLSQRTDDSMDEDNPIDNLAYRLQNQTFSQKLNETASRKSSDEVEIIMKDIIYTKNIMPKEELQKLQQLICQKMGRDSCIRKLNLFRSNQQCILKSKESYDNLVEVMNLILDECQKQPDQDVQSAMKIIGFSNNFYYEYEKRGMMEKEYVFKGIQKHKIWRDFEFWDNAIDQCIQNDLREHKNYIDLDRFNVTRQIVQAKLFSIQYDMLSLELDKEKIKDIIQRVAQNYELLKQDIFELMSRIDNFGVKDEDSTPKENYSAYASMIGSHNDSSKSSNESQLQESSLTMVPGPINPQISHFLQQVNLKQHIIDPLILRNSSLKIQAMDIQ